MIYLVRNEWIHCEKLPAPPKDAKAPEGSLMWSRLTLGESAFLLCFVDAAGPASPKSPAKLYVDRDGDGDLAEEKPVGSGFVAGHMPGAPGRLTFDVDALPAKFVLEKETLACALRVQLTAPDKVYLFTAFGGTGEDFIEGLGLSWIPGQNPVICNLSTGQTFAAYYAGPCAISPGTVSVKDGKVIGTYKKGEDSSLASVKVPKDVVSVRASFANQGGPHLPVILCKPENGAIFLPPRAHSIQAKIVKTEGKDLWSLVSVTPSFVARKGADFGPIEPLTYRIRITPKGGGIEFWPNPADASNRTGAYINRNGVRMEAPKLQLKDGAGTVVATLQFSNVCTWLGPIVWKPTAELAGKELTAELVLAKSPFQILTPPAAFTVPPAGDK
ncbi:MAG: hypothetical protein ACYTHN_24575 [Planctomycetota bacterium]|jgi:hypothetical protein